ncbi:MAG: hypothetical protein ABI718_04015 [Acidobacteriota bacterium]
MRERAFTAGEPTPLAGVVTEPSEFDPDRSAVLILNSGVMHHVGSCRLSVKVARAIATRGMLAVRFDFSGIGDSDQRRSTESFEITSRKECSEVMDYVQRTRGTRRFIVFGLCSGADAAYNAALADDRVVAFAQIDGYCYVTPRYYFERYWPVVKDPSRWKRFLERRRRQLLNPSTMSPVDGVAEEFLELPAYRRVFPSRKEVASGLQRLVERGVNMYINFTGGEPHYNYRDQFQDSFRKVNFGGLLRVDFYPGTNHIITQAADQRMIVNNIATWAAGLNAVDWSAGEGPALEQFRTA